MKCLFIIDLQNDFRQIITKSMIENIRKVVMSCKQNKIPIFWIYSIYDPKCKMIKFDDRLDGTHSGKQRPMCVDGTSGAGFINDITDLIDDNDIIFKKTYYSAFKNTNLKDKLNEMNIDDIIVCGVTANTCVLATSKYASEYGMNVTMLTDCVSSFSDEKTQEGIEIFSKFANCKISTSITFSF